MKDYKTLEVKIIETKKEIKGLQNTEINYKIKNRSIGYRKDLNIIPYIKPYLSFAKQLTIFKEYVSTPDLHPVASRLPATTCLTTPATATAPAIATATAIAIATATAIDTAKHPASTTATDPPYLLFLFLLLALLVFIS